MTETTRSSEISKRRFLAGAAAVGLTGLALPNDALAAAAMAFGRYYVDPQETFDVIVIGAGTAGMPLAIQAAQRGKVLVIDKGDRVGGTLFLSGGMMSAAGTNLQKRKGINDTPQALYDETMAMSHGKANPDTLRIHVDNSARTLNWLEEIGLQFPAEQPTLGVHAEFATRRYHGGPDGGRSLLEVFLPRFTSAEAAGRIRVLLNSSAAELTKSRDGAVTGVIVTDYMGRRTQYRGRNVVLTAGGALRNPVLFRKWHNGRTLAVETGNAHSRGEGILIGEMAGAHVSGGEMYIGAPGSILPNRDFPQPALARASMDARRRKPWEVFVNKAGLRFMAEDDGVNGLERKTTDQPGMCTHVVWDQAIYDKAPPLIGGLTRQQQDNLFDKSHTMFARGATIEEAARKAGLPPARVAETVAAYNRAQASGADSFGRKYMPMPIATGPFYIVETYTSNLMTWAGVDVNAKLQVVDAQKRPIPNLYAAGENTGAWQCSGDVIVNGCMVTPAITFGRLLGERMLPI